MQKIRFTKEGFENLKKELLKLKAERPLAVADLKKARDMGDLSENGYYKAARQKLSSIDHRLRVIDYQLKEAVIIEVTTVVLKNSDDRRVTYRIVGDLEADPQKGTVSHKSPIGMAVKGKSAGDFITITTPSKKIDYKIEDIG